MEKTARTRKIICDSQGRIFTESLEETSIDLDGVSDAHLDRFFYCDCGALIKDLNQLHGRCFRCQRLTCFRCGSLCEGSNIVCGRCCYLKSHGINKGEGGFYCFSCKFRLTVLKAISSMFRSNALRRSGAIVRR